MTIHDESRATSLGRVVGSHVAALLAFASVAVLWSYPLVSHFSTALPGAVAGDNLDSLWNLWWMRAALASHASFFHSPYLFAPAGGADLTLHTHSVLQAAVGATIFSRLALVPAENLLIMLSLVLNGYCTWLLARRLTGDPRASMVAGLVFAGSPYIAAHLNGHFNLIGAWVIPLFVLLAIAMLQSGSVIWAAAAGMCVGATAFLDYYYVLYEGVILLLLVALSAGTLSAQPRTITNKQRRRARVVAALMAIDAAVVVAIVITGGLAVRSGPIRFSARDTFNPLQGFWILSAVFLWICRPWNLRVAFNGARHLRRVIPGMLALGAAFTVVASPILLNAARLLWNGGYVAPTTFWRSGAPGVDLASLVLGNPFNGLIGSRVASLYARFGIDTIESIAWLGIAPLLLALCAVSSQRNARTDFRRRVARDAVIIGGVFFIWALGPHLRVFGFNTAMPLPFAVLRYIPIVSNARIPGRAMVVVYLALAILAASGLVALVEREKRFGASMTVAAALAVSLDFLAAPFPLTTLPEPGIYRTLRAEPGNGTLLELPLGLRDGFGVMGTWDDRSLWYQTIHLKPIVGGFVARLPSSVVASYAADDLLSALIALSDNDAATMPTLPDRQAASVHLEQDRIEFVMLDQAAASSALTNYVEDVLPVQKIASDDVRSLYAVVPLALAPSSIAQ